MVRLQRDELKVHAADVEAARELLELFEARRLLGRRRLVPGRRPGIERLDADDARRAKDGVRDG